MGFKRALDFGIRGHSAKEARRLRVLNLACWASAASWLGFAILYYPDPKLRTVATIDALMALMVSGVPLLNRFGSRVAAAAFVAVSLPATFLVCFLLGTDTGIQLQFLGYAGGVILIWGTRPSTPPIALAVCALACIIVLEFLAPADGGLLTKQSMRGGFVASVSASILIIVTTVFFAVRETETAEAVAEREYDRSESLLRNILPTPIADRLKSNANNLIADAYDDASVLFADMAGFTAAAGRISAADLVQFLNEIFSALDTLVEQHGLEKIKTSGDSYMVVSGVPKIRRDHANALVRLAVDMLAATRNMRDPAGQPVSIRIGIASGPVVAGVVGARKLFYDVWGDTVNVASRMESSGLPGRIQVSPESYRQLRHEFDFEERGPIEVKGKGMMTTWLLRQEQSRLMDTAQPPFGVRLPPRS